MNTLHSIGQSNKSINSLGTSNFEKRDTINVRDSILEAQMSKEMPNKFRVELVPLPLKIL